MLLSVVLIAALSLCQARPQEFIAGVQPSLRNGGEQYIVGGTDADPGEFPWQLSLQLLIHDFWIHICGATLLTENFAITAAHCVFGVPVHHLRVIAGLYKQSDLTGTQTVYLSDYTVHDHYLIGDAVLANDLAILEFATPVTSGVNIQPAELPEDDSGSFKGDTCIITGWGRTDRYFDLPDTLQKASIEVIGTHECQEFFHIHDVIWRKNICLFDCEKKVGSCTGDGGGPVNCPGGNSTVVAGVGSWEVTSFHHGVCQQRFPSVYTRIIDYLDWIYDNTDI